jgi:two-component system cell cycle sensor histidine kinase/response regulator CckA
LAEAHRCARVRGRAASSHLKPTVLLVDDQAAVRDLVARQLQAGGYRVIPAASGRDALAILTQHAATIDLLLTDIMMPGMIGPQLVAVVQLRWPAVRALYLSGGAEDWAVELMRDTGAECLKKPFTEGELRTALAAVLPAAAMEED